MAASYEVWLTDDAGRRILLVQGYSTLAYARSLLGLSTMQIILPYREWVKQVSPYFQADWRMEIYRSPMVGMPLRREGVYFLREPRIYTRDKDNVQMIQFYGRNAYDLLRRRVVMQAAGTEWTRKEGTIDDLMKQIVREQMLYAHALDGEGVRDDTRAYPEDEFSVEEDLGMGSWTTVNCADRNVLDVLKELKDESFQTALEDPEELRIYFDVTPVNIRVEYIQDESGRPILDEAGKKLVDESATATTAKMGFMFQTFAGLFGTDRTLGTVFSVENGNLQNPYYSLSHLEEENTAIVKGFGRGDSRLIETVQDSEAANQSRWNRCEVFVDASDEPDQDNLENYGLRAVWEGRAQERLTAIFVNTPGGPDAPRSLYGVDWDLGDMLPVEYAGKRMDIEVNVVYVAIDETGIETITGRNEVQSEG